MQGCSLYKTVVDRDGKLKKVLIRFENVSSRSQQINRNAMELDVSLLRALCLSPCRKVLPNMIDAFSEELLVRVN